MKFHNFGREELGDGDTANSFLAHVYLLCVYIYIYIVNSFIAILTHCDVQNMSTMILYISWLKL